MRRALTPAPKRGQYDRALSRQERQAAQRERVIGAIVALSGSKRELNLVNVIERAGIGRNTFYEYFDDIEHALLAVQVRAVRELATRIDAALREARTPLARMRAVSRAWVENLFEDAALVRLSLRAQAAASNSTQLSVLGEHIVAVLAAEVDARSALPGLSEPLRVLAVAALFDAISRVHLSALPAPTDDFPRLLTELMLRLLR
jgi:AcrR family transcriptional regulator